MIRPRPSFLFGPYAGTRGDRLWMRGKISSIFGWMQRVGVCKSSHAANCRNGTSLRLWTYLTSSRSLPTSPSLSCLFRLTNPQLGLLLIESRFRARNAFLTRHQNARQLGTGKPASSANTKHLAISTTVYKETMHFDFERIVSAQGPVETGRMD